MACRVLAKARKDGGSVVIPGRKVATLNQGYSYWSTLDVSLLSQLEQQYDSHDRPDMTQIIRAKRYSGWQYLKHSKLPGFEHKVLRYVVAAARLTSLPAQGIVKRLYEALGQSCSATVGTSQMEDWLFHAACTGSSIAAEDLAKIDLTRWRTARAEFKTSGGYNEVLMGTAGKFRNVDVKKLAMSVISRGRVFR
jgi:hypothetical protein